MVPQESAHRPAPPRQEEAPGHGTATVPCSLVVGSSGLEISEVRISPRDEDKLKAFVSVTLNHSIVIRGLKIIDGRERLFVAMPSRPKSDGKFQDVVHPINKATRDDFENHVLGVYYEVMEKREIP